MKIILKLRSSPLLTGKMAPSWYLCYNRTESSSNGSKVVFSKSYKNYRQIEIILILRLSLPLPPPHKEEVVLFLKETVPPKKKIFIIRSIVMKISTHM